MPNPSVPARLQLTFMNATAKPPASPPLAIPDELAGPLAKVRLRLWTTKILEMLCVVCMLLITAYLLVFSLERLWDTSSAGRRLTLMCLIGCTGTLGAFTIYRWVLHHHAWKAMGHFLQRWNRRHGDRVLAAIELTSADGDTLAMESPQLRAAAIKQLAGQIAETDLQAAVDQTTIRKRALILAGLALPAVLSLLLAPQASLNTSKRLFLPWQDTDRYTFVDLQTLPATLVIPHGEPFDITATLSAQAHWQPNSGKATLLTTNQQTEAARDGQSYQFHFPGLIAAETARLSIGDCVRELRIEPTIRPGLTSLVAEVTRPPYLQLPPVEKPVAGSQFDAVSGSMLTFTGTISRALAEVDVRSEPKPSTSLSGTQFTTSVLAIQETPLALEIHWRDQLGLEGKSPHRFRLLGKEDSAPLVTLHSDAPSQIAMLEDDALLLSVRAKDDFGIREIGYLWGDTDLGPAEAWNIRQRLQPGQPDMDQLGADLTFAPKKLGLENKTWNIWAYALDYKPDRAPAFSEPRSVLVLNHREHAEVIQAQFGQLQEQLEDIARQESHLKETTEALAKHDTLDAEAIKQQREAELRNAKALEKLAKNSEKLLQDALKNKALDQSALAPWSEMMATMKEVATQDMPAVAEALQEAASEASSGGAGGSPTQVAGGGKAALAEAAEKQQEAVNKLSKAMQQGQQTKEKLEAATFINRLRIVGDGESSLASTMRTAMMETLGLSPAELTSTQKVTLSKRQHQQSEWGKETQYILSDLQHYHQRTKKEAYAKVHSMMQAADVVTEMGLLEQRLLRNQHGWVVRSALHWSEQFHAWADALSPKQGETPPADESGSGEGSMQGDMRTMLALMRLVQREMPLRNETRLLDQRKEVIDDHTSQASALASEQWTVGRSVAGILATVFQPAVQQRLHQAAKAIDDAGKLLDQANTSGETIAAQTEVIELLGQAAKSSGQGAGKSAGMEALADMLEEMQIGNSPGGNPIGGTSSLASQKAKGAADRDDAEDRNIDKTSGLAHDDLPAEFRDALGYFFEQREVLLKEFESSTNDAAKP